VGEASSKSEPHSLKDISESDSAGPSLRTRRGHVCLRSFIVTEDGGGVPQRERQPLTGLFFIVGADPLWDITGYARHVLGSMLHVVISPGRPYRTCGMRLCAAAAARRCWHRRRRGGHDWFQRVPCSDCKLVVSWAPKAGAGGRAGLGTLRDWGLLGHPGSDHQLFLPGIWLRLWGALKNKLKVLIDYTTALYPSLMLRLRLRRFEGES